MTDRPMPPTPTLDLDAIEARCNAATPGPWAVREKVASYAVARVRPDA